MTESLFTVIAEQDVYHDNHLVARLLPGLGATQRAGVIDALHDDPDDEQAERIAELEEEVKQLESELEDVRAERDAKDASIDEAQSERDHAWEASALLRERVEELESELAMRP